MTTKYGFELVREQHVPEYDTQAALWRHIKTGAEFLSLQNSDENKVFAVNFRTPVHDSTGVAHIMEHAVLAGSRKYPLREPFVELIKGSLNTFVNAFTYPDKTCYPVASQNTRDLYNLIDVYLDAVFYPLLRRHTFEQEGWHYELDQATDPLTYKGIVFNEMKGAYSSPDSVLDQYVQQSIFPDNNYRFESGGDPKVIPDLTYEAFKDFHDRYYHPSNARIYWYGDDDADERLRYLDGWLAQFTAQSVDSTIPLQPRFSAPKLLNKTYAASDDGADGSKSMLAVSWLLSETTDVETSLGLGILEYVLTGMPASPLRKALIDSGLGEDLAGSGVVDELRQMYFSTGLKGIVAKNAAEVEALIHKTLQDLADGGIDPETVRAALNTVEFRLRENNTGSFPRGLALMLRVLSTWLYDGDPFGELLFEAPLNAIKAQVEAGQPYFENLIRRFLLDNTHRTTLLLEPDRELAARDAAAEQARLDTARAAMSEADLAAIVEDTRELKLMQETPDSPEALATIPMLALADLDKENKNIPIDVQEENGARILYHDLFTNGIAYLDVGLDLHSLAQDLLPYIPLFGRALLEMGAGEQDFVQLSQRIGSETGGIRPQTLVSAVRGSKSSTAWLFLRGKATAAETGKLLDVLTDVLLRPHLDEQERFRQMVLEEKAGMEAQLAGRGHIMANSRVRAHFDEAGWANEQMGGVSYLLFLRGLAAQVDADWPAVRGTLEQIRATLVNRSAMLLNVTLDEAGWAQFKPQLTGFLGGLPTADAGNATWSTNGGATHEGLVIPANVNYVGQGANLYDLGYELSGSNLVITNLLGTTWLWERVRVQGGAYGGFCVFDFRSGVWTYLSYRDPNLLATLDVYKGTGKFLQELDLGESELTSAIIGAIGTIDDYQLPDAKGWTALARYLTGDSDADRQRRREQVLNTSLADFHQFGAVLEKISDDAPVAILGSQAALDAAGTERPGWLTITPVM